MTGVELHPDALYWNRGVKNVPDMTGARHLLDAHDLREVCFALGLTLPLKNVIDVGCGTGRLAQLCDGYLGLDIAPDAVAYASLSGHDARVIRGPKYLEDSGLMADLITCISVFTHIDRSERLAYLESFIECAPRLLVDIIPGDGSGNVAMWTADPDRFSRDLRAAGYRSTAWVDQQWDMHTHRYFLAGV